MLSVRPFAGAHTSKTHHSTYSGQGEDAQNRIVFGEMNREKSVGLREDNNAPRPSLAAVTFLLEYLSGVSPKRFKIC